MLDADNFVLDFVLAALGWALLLAFPRWRFFVLVVICFAGIGIGRRLLGGSGIGAPLVSSVLFAALGAALVDFRKVGRRRPASPDDVFR
ncbi:MAG: hypothetical protein ABUL42_02190 [Terricaulis silvestris]